MRSVIVAVILSCALISLPVLAAMVVVKHAGVNLSGPRYTPLDDNMLYVRFDEGHLAALVALARRRSQTVGTTWGGPNRAPDGRELVALWDAAEDGIPVVRPFFTEAEK